MATVSGLVDRVRLELGDVASDFQSVQEGDGSSVRFALPNKPVRATGLTVLKVSPTIAISLASPTDYTLNAAEGYLTLASPLLETERLVVTGQAYRLFTDDQLTLFVNTAVAQHLHNRSGVTLAGLPDVEEYPVALGAVVEALFALVNEAAYDINIQAPEGVMLQRSQRYEQLLQMLMARQAQYRELCMALNIGLNRVETLPVRRKSRTTNRLVPIYESQEFRDPRPPRQIFPPIDTLGGSGDLQVPSLRLDLVGYSQRAFEQVVETGVNLTGNRVRASVRTYPSSLQPLAVMTVQIIDAVAGTVKVSLTADLMYFVGISKFWDLQMEDASHNITTLVAGTFDAVRQGGGGGGVLA